MKWNKKFVIGSIFLPVALAAMGWWWVKSSSSTSNSITNTNISGVVTQDQNGNNTFNMQQRSRFSSIQKVNTLPTALGGAKTLNLDNMGTRFLASAMSGSAFDPKTSGVVVLWLGSATTFPDLHTDRGSLTDRWAIPSQGKYVFDPTHQRQEVAIEGRIFIVTLKETHELVVAQVPNAKEYVFGISEK